MANILVVDDSLMMRKFITMALIPDGHNITEASGGNEAIEVAVKSPPDCMVLDLLMPDVVGTEVLEELKIKHGMSFPIIVMTADIQESTQSKCMELGAYRVLTKPPKGGELSAAVKEAVSAHGAK
jgi:DNA-binding response OmpR family regulator